MSRVKIQHYVPRFYLKQFCFNEEYLWVFDKATKKTFKSNIENIAGEKGFYDIVLEESFKGFDPQIVEVFLSMIESDSPILLNDIIDSIQEQGIISSKLKEQIAYYLAIQHLRTASFRKQIIELEEKTFNNLLKTNTQADEYFVEFDEEKASLEHALMMLSPNMLNGLVAAFQDHFWVLGVNKTGTPLWTSDNPVVKRAHKTDHYVSYEGFGSEGIEIAFPLTPKYILLLFERKYHYYMETLHERPLPLADKQMIIYYNSLQVIHSSRQLYCSSNEFDLAESMCEKDPNLSNPNRDRIEVV